MNYATNFNYRNCEEYPLITDTDLLDALVKGLSI